VREGWWKVEEEEGERKRKRGLYWYSIYRGL